MKQNNITIVPMEICHVPQIAALEYTCFADPWSERSVENELLNPLSLWLVATIENNMVVGYIGSQTVLCETDLMNLAVKPGYRKLGIAQALLEKLEQQLIENGVHCISLEVRESNEAAINLYQKLGYVQVGCRRGYYRMPREDARILRKECKL